MNWIPRFNPIAVLALLLFGCAAPPRPEFVIPEGPEVSPPSLETLRAAAGPSMAAHFIKVGQGNATLFEFPCGAILVDAGGQSADTTDHLVAYLETFFQRRSDLNHTLKAVFITHPHIDHTRALKAVAQQFNVERYIDNGQQYGSGGSQVRWMRENATTDGRNVQLKEVLDSEIQALPHRGGLTDEVIDPLSCASCDPAVAILAAQQDHDPGWPPEDYDNSNNHSLVIRIDFGESSFLLSGDLEERAIEALVAWYQGSGTLDVDVYHVGHHGSHNGSTDAFLAAMSPLIAVISCGQWNDGEGTSSPFCTWRYGHPRRVTMDLLTAHLARYRSSSVVAQVADGSRQFRAYEVKKAIYATPWDGNLRVRATLDGGFRVTRVD